MMKKLYVVSIAVLALVLCSIVVVCFLVMPPKFTFVVNKGMGGVINVWDVYADGKIISYKAGTYRWDARRAYDIAPKSVKLYLLSPCKYLELAELIEELKSCAYPGMSIGNSNGDDYGFYVLFIGDDIYSGSPARYALDTKIVSDILNLLR